MLFMSEYPVEHNGYRQPNVDVDPYLQEALAALWAQARPITLNRVEQIEAALIAWSEQNLDQALLNEARRSAHQLAGSIGTFYSDPVTDIAQRLYSILKQMPDLSILDYEQAMAMLISLRSIIENLHPNNAIG
jgi:chemotaxis protein histidine kinase CheA